MERDGRRSGWWVINQKTKILLFTLHLPIGDINDEKCVGYVLVGG